MAIVEIDPRDPRWDAFVSEHADASVYHLSAWAHILHDAYGYEPRYLGIADSNGELRGGLPAMEIDGLLGGRRLCSLPVVPAAGALAASTEDLAGLLGRACELTKTRRAGSLTLFSHAPSLDALEPRLVSLPKTPRWVIPLPADPDELETMWRGRSRNLHRSIERARRAPLTIREGRSDDDLREFYALYLDTMRRHNVLPRSSRQLTAARDSLPPGVFGLLLVEHAGRTIAGVVLHEFNGALDVLYNGSDLAHLDLRPNHALYRHAIRRAVVHGCHSFDFGRAVPGTPLARFKSQWGAEPVPEYRYEMMIGRPRALAVRRRDAIDRLAVAHGRPRLVRRAWDHAPLRLTRVAGELAYRWF